MRRRVLGLLLAVCVMAGGGPIASAQQAPPSGAQWQAGPNALGDDTYAGGIDVPSSGATLPVDKLVTLSGWFVDTAAQGWAGADDMQVVNGTLDNNGTSLTHGTLGLPRGDVAASLNNPYWASAGFSATVDPAALAPGPNTLSVYLHTPGKGWWYTQVSVNVVASSGGVSGPALAVGGPIVTVSAPLDGERISTHVGDYRIMGTARDPVAGPKAIDRIQVWLNGEHDTPNATLIGEPDIATDGTWGLDFFPVQYTAIESNLYVYVHSDVSNKTTLTLVHFQIANSN